MLYSKSKKKPKYFEYFIIDYSKVSTDTHF